VRRGAPLPAAGRRGVLQSAGLWVACCRPMTGACHNVRRFNRRPGARAALLTDHGFFLDRENRATGNTVLFPLMLLHRPEPAR